MQGHSLGLGLLPKLPLEDLVDVMSPATVHDQTQPQGWRDITFTVRDGLRLYARHYPAIAGTGRRPVVCLPGMIHNSLDFEDIALVLSQAGSLARDVYTLDYRGRGRSEHDPDWRNYTPFFEMLDVLDFLALARLHNAAVIGTSRGGIVAMIMAAVRPGAIGAGRRPRHRVAPRRHLRVFGWRAGQRRRHQRGAGARGR